METSTDNKSLSEEVSKNTTETEKAQQKSRKPKKDTSKKNIYAAAVEEGKLSQAEALKNDEVNQEKDTADGKISISGAVGSMPAATADAETDMVGLNLRISKDRRAHIKSWCALRNIPMNELFAKMIDQVLDGEYDPLNLQ